MLHRGTIFNDNFNAILLHKKSIRVHGVSVQTIFNATLFPQRTCLHNFEQVSNSYNVVAIN